MALVEVSQGLIPNNSRKNYLINANFDVWQRGTSHSTTAFGSVDRWRFGRAGSGFTFSQQAFAVGQTAVPNNPKYYGRTVVTSVAGAASAVLIMQRIEDVTKLANKTVTLSFWAKADANKNIAVEFTQDFGTGGTPSAQVTSIGVTTLALTTSWQKFTVTASLPSISGKTLGTDGNDHLLMHIWFEAGSNFDARTNTLGQQSGTFDVAQAQLEEGSVATDFEYRHPGEEFLLCARYYFQWTAAGQGTRFNVVGAAHSATAMIHQLPLPAAMRVAPTVTISNWSQTGLGGTPTVVNSYQYNITTIRAVYGGTFTSGAAGTCGVDLIVDAEL